MPSAELAEKACTKCRETKPLTEFGVRWDGPCARCKTCVAEYRRRWYAANPEKAREHARRHAEKHPERLREMRRRIYQQKVAGRPAKLCACGVEIPYIRRKCDECRMQPA